MFKRLYQAASIVCLALLLTLTMAVQNSFAASHASAASQNLPCTSPEFEESGYGYNSKEVPGPNGAFVQVYDYFHQQGCVTFFDHYTFDGYAGADIFNENADLALTTAIRFDGLGVSFSFPVGAGFTPASGDSVTHTISRANTSYIGYNYGNVDASVFSCFAIHQTDTIVASIGNSDYQTAAEVTLSCG